MEEEPPGGCEVDREGYAMTKIKNVVAARGSCKFDERCGWTEDLSPSQLELGRIDKCTNHSCGRSLIGDHLWSVTLEHKLRRKLCNSEVEVSASRYDIHNCGFTHWVFGRQGSVRNRDAHSSRECRKELRCEGVNSTQERCKNGETLKSELGVIFLNRGLLRLVETREVECTQLCWVQPCQIIARAHVCWEIRAESSLLRSCRSYRVVTDSPSDAG